MTDPHDREPVDQATIDCWRVNYGLDKRTPAQAAKWWSDTMRGLAPSGCVAALGVALDELEALRALAAPSVPSGEPLQGGMENEVLRAAWDKKLPGVEPTDRELSAFALGVEVGFAHARDLERQAWSRVHHVLAKHGKHPGRTDDHLADIIDRALTSPQPATAVEPMAQLVDAVQANLGIAIPEQRALEIARAVLRVAQPAPAGWRPIETAPKDMGAYLFRVNGIAVEGFRDATVQMCVRNERHEWRAMRGKPTHWMPLPAFPTVKESLTIAAAPAAPGGEG
jgi:hypothetical protein